MGSDFRQNVREINSNSWIIGEIWGDARPWLKGKHFDGVMNYRIGWSTISWVGKDKLNSLYHNPNYPLKEIETDKYINILETTFGWYPKHVNSSQLNLLDSHDVPRALNSLKGDIPALKLAIFLLFIQPGVPCIYYGTEIGLNGGEEPNCRESFTWNLLPNNDLLDFIKSLSLFRKDFLQCLDVSMNWEAIGKDVLSGWVVVPSKSSSGSMLLIRIWINRSRDLWASIPKSLSQPSFLLGEIELLGRGLGPQSAIVFKEMVGDVSSA